jgi:hypothetical protein
MDIYFLSSILNIVWYIFSILFVLYRFTSFFSYIYGFMKFLGKLLKGLVYIKNQIFQFFERRQGQYIERTTNTSIFTRLQQGLYYICGREYSQDQQQEITPLYDVRASYAENNINNSGPNYQDRNMFDQHIHNVLDSQISDQDNNNNNNDYYTDSNNDSNNNYNSNSNTLPPTSSFISIELQSDNKDVKNNNSNLLFHSSVINNKLKK